MTKKSRKAHRGLPNPEALTTAIVLGVIAALGMGAADAASRRWWFEDGAAPGQRFATAYELAQKVCAYSSRTYVSHHLYQDLGNSAQWRVLCETSGGSILESGFGEQSALPENLGPPCPKCGNPVNPSNGNKYQLETDYVGTGPMPLILRRHYNSRGTIFSGGSLDTRWRTDFDARLNWNTANRASILRADGVSLGFAKVSGSWVADADFPGELTEITGGAWEYTNKQADVTERYDANGRLQWIANREGLKLSVTYDTQARVDKVEDPFGRALTFAYDTSGRLSTVTDPNSQTITYAYDTSGRLSTVTYPGAATRTYVYENTTNTTSLTGIVDELSNRYATWSYDGSNRATLSEHGSGINKYTFSYNSPQSGQTTVNEYTGTTSSPVQTSRTYEFATVLGLLKSTAISGADCPSCGPAGQSFDANGNAASRTDWNGNRTNYSYDLARNLETQRVEGLTSAGATTAVTRTISTQWHSNFRLPTVITEPLRKTTNVYDADGTSCGATGALCSRTIEATTDIDGSQGFSATTTGSPRAWAYTNNANGSVLTVNGPRTDITDTTTYTYYANNASCPTAGGGHATGCRGQLNTVSNALGHTTTVNTYNTHGQPLSVTDPNGLVTTMVYDTRMRLTTRTVGSETTAYEYDGVGQLKKVTLPDSSFLSYTYDAAHRLTAIEDNLGNKIAYTLDALGNRTLEEVRDPANSLAQTRSRVYSNLNRLFQEIGATGQTTQYGYDNQGNVTTVNGPLTGNVDLTTNQYDAFNRLKQVTDPNSGVTQYGYNGLDALTTVTDPRNLATGYTVDGLGNLTQQASPDTGTTVNSYDAAGNLLTQIDAKGQVTTYVYDALNRVTSITFHDGAKQTYAYDAGSNGIGRLSRITEQNPALVTTATLAYAYDSHGRVTSETRTVGGVAYVTGYGYDSSGRMSGMTYPSGRTLTYSFDALGRVSQVTTTKDAQSQTLVQNVQYHPFGGVKSFTLGNGQIYARSIDLDGRVASYTLGAANYTVGFDAASRITSITEAGNPSNVNTYGYDTLDRLTSAVLPSSNYGYSYDAVGNRLTKTTGAATDIYTYGATSNRIATLTPASGSARSFSFDSNGSTTNDAVNQFAYDTKGRMVSATTAQGTTTYQVNALGQRIRKTNSADDRIFVYDTRGKLISENDSGGTLKREYLYLGDIPVGVVQ